MRPMPELPGVEHRFADVRGLRTHVALAGEGEPLVLLHGWPQHWWQWRYVLPELARQHRVICPDLRGLGWTAAPPERGGYRAEAMARDVLTLLDQLGVRRFGLVGHDWGGAAGYLIALRAPARVTGFVAINTASPFLGPTPPVLLDGTRLWHIPANAAGFVPRIARWALAHWSRSPIEDRDVFLAQFAEPGRVRATAAYYRNLLARDIPATLSGRFRGPLDVPVLVLSGDRDPLLPPRQMALNPKYAKDFRMKLLEGTGHFPATEAPGAVAANVLEFLNAQGLTRP